MTSHLSLLILFALFVSVVFAALLRDDPREQLRLGAMMFGALVATAVVASWIMYPFPF